MCLLRRMSAINLKKSTKCKILLTLRAIMWYNKNIIVHLLWMEIVCSVENVADVSIIA